MGGGFNRFSEKAKDSNLGLKDEIDVHLLGPYTGLCSHILEELTSELQKDGYSAYTCAELDYPSIPGRHSNNETNLLKSKKCLQRAGAAVFIFLEPAENRIFRPSVTPQEINTSVCIELEYWLGTLGIGGHRTFVVFEGETREIVGSLIDGTIEHYGVESIDIDFEDYPEMFDQIESQCWNWVNRFC